MEDKLICVYDAYDNWIKQIRRVAHCRDHWHFYELRIGDEIPSGAYVFIRPTMEETQLDREKEWMSIQYGRDDLHFITDLDQIILYEDKCAQFHAFGEFLPDTRMFTNHALAREWVENHTEWPIVSKAAVGASSQFVHIVDKPAALEIVEQAFGDGIPLNHSNWDRQRGYVLFQRFLPNNPFTWRVNVIGDEVALFKRFNYPDRPVAQTGNTHAVCRMTDDAIEVAEYGKEIAQMLGTKWVALDILRDFDGWKLLETSLGWPWPGVGEKAQFFPSRRPWSEMFELMFDQAEQGVFDED